MNLFQVVAGEGPVVAAAIHAGHFLRPEVAEYCALADSERQREEDPWTDVLAEAAPTRLVGGRSRFEVDLNRPLEGAVYREPDDCWGLCVWRTGPPQALVDRSLDHYKLFYATAEALLERLINTHRRVVVLDIHSYNHRRDGAHRPPADAATDPEVNIGTGSMDRAFWAPVVDRFIADLCRCEAGGHSLDVRENVRFRGGHFCRFLHQRFPRAVCGLAIEFKKTFMDEWSGEVDREHLSQLQTALRSTLAGVHAALEEIDDRGPRGAHRP